MEAVEVHKIVCELDLALSRRYAEYAYAIVYFWICSVVERFVELAGILFSAVKHCVFLPVQNIEKNMILSWIYMRRLCDVMWWYREVLINIYWLISFSILKKGRWLLTLTLTFADSNEVIFFLNENEHFLTWPIYFYSK